MNEWTKFSEGGQGANLSGAWIGGISGAIDFRDLDREREPDELKPAAGPDE